MTEHTAPKKRVFETRWWLWCIAVATLVAIVDFRRRLTLAWEPSSLIEAALALVGLVVTCALWRGAFFQGVLLISAALCVYTMIRAAFGH